MANRKTFSERVAEQSGFIPADPAAQVEFESRLAPGQTVLARWYVHGVVFSTPASVVSIEPTHVIVKAHQDLRGYNEEGGMTFSKEIPRRMALFSAADHNPDEAPSGVYPYHGEVW